MHEDATEHDCLTESPPVAPSIHLKVNHHWRDAIALYCLDAILSSVVISPLIIAYWRGTWTLIDIHGDYFPDISCFILSTVCILATTLLRPVLKESFAKAPYNRIIRKCFTYAYSLISVLQYRCYWNLVDEMFSVTYDENDIMLTYDLRFMMIMFMLSLFLLFSMKCLVNVMGEPFSIDTDDVDPFEFPTRFKLDLLVQKTSLYILDCLFSVLIVGTLVVFVWRGAWVLLDIYIFPDNDAWSAWASLVIGYMVVAIAFLMQPIMRWLCDRLNGAMRLLAADLFLLFSLLGTVNVWRGIWNLLNLYFLPDDMELSCWLTHWVSLILLILMGTSNSLLVRGVYIDAEEPAGKCVVFPCYYLRLIFQQEREKKHQNGVQMVTSDSKPKQEENDNHVTVSIDTGNHI